MLLNNKYLTLIPLLYGIQRDMLRFSLTFPASSIRLISGFIRYVIWIPLFVIIFTAHHTPHLYVTLLIQLLIFIIVYEMGYLITDNIAILFENPSISNKVYETPASLWYVAGGIVTRISLLYAIILIGLELPVELYMIVMSVFVIHAITNEKYRIITFIALRILKGYIPFAWLIQQIPVTEQLLILAAISGIAIYYSIEYGPRKMGIKTINVFNERYSVIRFGLILCLILPIVLIKQPPITSIALLLLSIALTHVGIVFLSHIKRLFIKTKNQQVL